MRAEPGRALHALADAVADGEPVDWSAVLGRLRDPAKRRLFHNLRIVAELSREGAIATEVEPAPEEDPLWFRVLVGWSVVHVVGGIIALLIAPRDTGPIPPGVLAANAVAFAGVAVALLMSRGADSRTRDLAGVFLCLASACSHRPLRWLMTGDLSSSVALGLFRGLLPEAFIALFLWRFARGFPRVLRLSVTDRFVSTAIRIAALVGITLFVVNAVCYSTYPARPHAHPVIGWLARAHPSGTYWIVLFALGLAALATVMMRSREAPVSERRRVTLFSAALAFGLGPSFLTVLVGYLFERAGLFASQRGLLVSGLVAYVPLLTVPFTTTYAIASRRVLSVRFVLRRTAQRLLARSTLVGVPAATTLMLGAYIYANRDHSVAVVITQAKGLLAVTALVLLLVPLRGWLLRSIDALAFGGAPNPTAVLAGLGAVLRASGSLADVVSSVSAGVARGVQAEWAAVVARDDSQGVFRAIGIGPRPLSLDSAVARVLEEDEATLITDPCDSFSVFRWLPRGDRDWVADNNVGAVVALPGVVGRPIGFIAIGPKLEELPWSADDRVFLSAVTTPVTLALETHGLGRDTGAATQGTGQADLAAAECLACGLVSSASERLCSCGGGVVATPLPKVLNAKFRVEQVLGRGGMGVVYRATDLELNRPVALKTLPRLSAEAAFRMRSEARSMATFVHPHLALIFGAESWHGAPVLVVEYLAGGTLARRLQARLAPLTVLSIGRTLARALEAMHARGLLHRDVKPTNIGFTEDGVPKLCDFGLARLLGGTEHSGLLSLPGDRVDTGVSLTRSGHLVGTPLYMSPEVLAGATPGPAQDLWALSMVLYESLTGTHPRRGVPLSDWHRFTTAPDPRALDPGLHPAVSSFFACALSPRPQNRQPTAADLARSIENLIIVSSMSSA